MSVIVYRSDCCCGGITGLYFSRVTVERVAPDAPEEGGAAGIITEYHYPQGSSQGCSFYLNGLAVPADRLGQVLVNSAPDTVKEYAERLDRACNDLEAFLQRDLDRAVAEAGS